MANPQRMRVVAELAGGRVHVSELARRLGMSRPLLYMHLDRLEKAGLVVGRLELSEDGKAMKYFELAPFDIRLTAPDGFFRREGLDLRDRPAEGSQHFPAWEMWSGFAVEERFAG